ncbi:uncharacterized protein LOC100830298 isoform X2 [Brachypodium distachyon]|uniref:uncharacterized protein LOC100830298 isoform X2 n=1 Tax=Brachypodium distachyon TaxID=15368 RepID=UPI000D0DCD12|nr:uncharacterized protein LOC100830298 isoform X2 [Brachypodium distachyon]|eukprot:XP_024311227.1 uncharacterized protein LOC100830298 isoform X2 [Brachypodium distachyon]
MPRLTPADASLILDHVVGDPSTPAAAANALLAELPFPSRPTRRLLRSVLLRRLGSDPVSPAALDTLQLLASLPTPAPAIAAAHLAVAAFLAASAPDFDAAAGALFARPDGRARRAVDEGGDPALVSPEAVAVADQFEAAVGNAFSQSVLRGLWGGRAAAEERVRELLVAEWAAIGPSQLEVAAERIVGDGAVETWRAAEESIRAKYRMLAGEERAREILSRLEEPTSNVNPISTPEVHKVLDALKSSCADLHSAVEDPLPAAKAAADEVLAARMDKAVDINAEEVNNQAASCSAAAGPSALNNQGEASRKGTLSSLMDWNSTARTFQWEDSLDPEGSRSQSHIPHLPSPRRNQVSPLQLADNKAKRRRARKWSSVEEETLRKGLVAATGRIF